MPCLRSTRDAIWAVVAAWVCIAWVGLAGAAGQPTETQPDSDKRCLQCHGQPHIAELNPVDSDNDELLLRRLAPFLLAGLTAPLPELCDVTRELDDALPPAA